MTLITPPSPQGYDDGKQTPDISALVAEKHIAEVKLAEANVSLARLRMQLEVVENERDEAKKCADYLAYILGDGDGYNPTIRDVAYNAFMRRASGTNPEDGGPCDWMNDTKPLVEKLIERMRARAALANRSGTGE